MKCSNEDGGMELVVDKVRKKSMATAQQPNCGNRRGLPRFTTNHHRSDKGMEKAYFDFRVASCQRDFGWEKVLRIHFSARFEVMQTRTSLGKDAA